MSEKPSGLFPRFFAVCFAHNVFAYGEHITCSLRSVFVHVQKVNCPEGAREATLGCAAAEKDFDFVFRLRGKFCEALLTVKKTP